MANWKHEIDLADLYAKFENGDIDDKAMLDNIRYAWYNFIDHNPYIQLLDDFYRLDDAVEELAIVESLDESALRITEPLTLVAVVGWTFFQVRNLSAAICVPARELIASKI